MEQVASLKDTVSKKDEEIEWLQLLKDLKNMNPGVNFEKRGTGSLRHGSPSPQKDSVGGTFKRSQMLSSGKGVELTKKAASDHDNYSGHCEAHFQRSMDDLDHQNEVLQQSKVAGGDTGQNIHTDAEILGIGQAAYEERLSDISDGGLSVGTETDGFSENSNNT
ncbi:Kinesin-like protein [Quillaja saponaria]|uniref:Kinesin-like protein n=1 Tax=Quillaja saponaria TaxID=32244 RepID=A0AAD7Q576_QUISA|nr:Kinesin-like protein [Quillaja saponaria]